MRRWIFAVLVVLLVVSMALMGFRYAQPTSPVASAMPAPAEEKVFGLDDIPEIQNKQPLNTIMETGQVWDKIIPYIERFTEKTGVKVNIERVASPVVYSKENVELVARTGVYDVTYVETAWTSEWSDYMWDLRELAAKYDPGGVAALEADMAHQSPVILRCGQAYGKQMVLPGYTYHMAMFLRQDVFDDPTEQANFKAKYGYDLKPAVTFEQLRDQAEFFTRKKGDTLKGQPLDHDLYGVSLQAGAYQINDEFSCYLWGKGADYASVMRDDAGNLKEFVITQQDKAAMKETMEQYIELLKYASPGCVTANFDFVIADIGEGRAIIVPTMFSNAFAWAAGLTDEHVPGGKLGVYPTLGARPYTGAWSFGVCKDSKNPEAAYWLVRYLASKECQTIIMKEGGQLSTRVDVLADPYWRTPELAYPFEMLCDYLIANWTDQEFVDMVGDRYYFNSKAGGKVYEMQMDVLAKPVHQETTVDEGLAELVKKTVELTTKFDITPIREE